MTPEDFSRLADRTRMSQTNRWMARLVLVDGLSAAAAGREARKSRALASRSAVRIRAEALREVACKARDTRNGE
jgi:hypothetical protein